MRITLWDKLCVWGYVLYLIFRYGVDLAEKITEDDYKKAVELKKRLMEKNDKILF